MTAAEKFTHKISGTATFTQGAAALWKMDDFGDALYIALITAFVYKF
jgi:hypothetical protein